MNHLPESNFKLEITTMGKRFKVLGVFTCQDKANAFMEKNKNAGVIAVSGPVIYVASVKEEKD